MSDFVELSSNGKSVHMTGEEFDRAATRLLIREPEKYKQLGSPFLYLAQVAESRVVTAAHPKGGDNKAAGRVLAEWVKLGYVISTMPVKDMHTIGRAALGQELDRDDDPLVFVAEQYCGCCVGVVPRFMGNNGAAKVLQVWAESAYFIQTIPLSHVFIEARCPHKPPEERQLELALELQDEEEDLE